MIMNIEYIARNGVPSCGNGGWLDPTWDKVLNSTIFKGIPKQADSVGNQSIGKLGWSHFSVFRLEQFYKKFKISEY